MNNLNLQLNYYTYAIILGALATLGFAQFNLTALLVLSLGTIYSILNEAITKRQAFLIGVWFGLSHFSSSLYWLAFFLGSDIYKFGWLIPFAIFGLSLFFSLYFAFAFLIFKISNYKNPIIFSVIITFSEFLRANLFTGFPWNLIGYSWNSLEILQFGSVAGIYGLTFLTVFLSGVAGSLMQKDDEENKKTFSYFFYAIFILVLLYVHGIFRLESNKTEYSNTKIRVVQANISHQAKWNRDYTDKVINKYIELTKVIGLGEMDYVIWPESSLPLALAKDSKNATTALSKVIPNTLIASGLRIEDNKVFNSIFVIKDGKITDYYDKVKLVPFGEYIPFRQFIPIKKIVNGLFDFNHGTDDKKILDTVIIPTICYEDIFTSFSFRATKDTEFIVNLTNDSWFGKSTGVYQHLQIARMRAIEYGLPMVRSTTTGISAIFDSYGRIIKKINLNEEGIIDTKLPKPIAQRTFYYHIQRFIDALPTILSTAFHYRHSAKDILFILCTLLSIMVCITLFFKLNKKTFYRNLMDFFFFFIILFSMFFSYAYINYLFFPLGILFVILYCIFLFKVSLNEKFQTRIINNFGNFSCFLCL